MNRFLLATGKSDLCDLNVGIQIKINCFTTKKTAIIYATSSSFTFSGIIVGVLDYLYTSMSLFNYSVQVPEPGRPLAREQAIVAYYFQQVDASFTTFKYELTFQIIPLNEYLELAHVDTYVRFCIISHHFSHVSRLISNESEETFPVLNNQTNCMYPVCKAINLDINNIRMSTHLCFRIRLVFIAAWNWSLGVIVKLILANRMLQFGHLD